MQPFFDGTLSALFNCCIKGTDPLYLIHNQPQSYQGKFLSIKTAENEKIEVKTVFKM